MEVAPVFSVRWTVFPLHGCGSVFCFGQSFLIVLVVGVFLLQSGLEGQSTCLMTSDWRRGVNRDPQRLAAGSVVNHDFLPFHDSDARRFRFLEVQLSGSWSYILL